MKQSGFAHAIIVTFFMPSLVLFAIANFLFGTTAYADTGDHFTRDIHEYQKVVRDGRGDWLSPASPWYFYLQRQYRDGLSPHQQNQHLVFQAKGQCGKVLKLEIIGFLALYPELTRALSDKVVKNIFSLEIIPSHSFGGMRCQAHALLNPIIEAEKKRDPQGYNLMIPGTNLSVKQGKVYDPREIVLRKAFAILFDLAACKDYKPAIKDIIGYRNLHLIFVGNIQIYYFSVRAKFYGLDAFGFGPIAIDVRPLKSSQREEKLQFFLAHGDLDAARKVVFDSTYISCGKFVSE